MRSPLDPGVTGRTVVFIVFSPALGATDTSKPSITTTHLGRPEWPEDDASFDYRMPCTSGARS